MIAAAAGPASAAMRGVAWVDRAPHSCSMAAPSLASAWRSFSSLISGKVAAMRVMAAGSEAGRGLGSARRDMYKGQRDNPREQRAGDGRRLSPDERDRLRRDLEDANRGMAKRR